MGGVLVEYILPHNSENYSNSYCLILRLSTLFYEQKGSRILFTQKMEPRSTLGMQVANRGKLNLHKNRGIYHLQSYKIHKKQSTEKQSPTSISSTHETKELIKEALSLSNENA